MLFSKLEEIQIVKYISLFCDYLDFEEIKNCCRKTYSIIFMIFCLETFLSNYEILLQDLVISGIVGIFASVVVKFR